MQFPVYGNCLFLGRYIIVFNWVKNNCGILNQCVSSFHFWQGWGNQGHMVIKNHFFGRHEGRRRQCYSVSGSMSRLGFLCGVTPADISCPIPELLWAEQSFQANLRTAKWCSHFSKVIKKNTLVMFSDQIVTDCHVPN